LVSRKVQQSRVTGLYPGVVLNVQEKEGGGGTFYAFALNDFVFLTLPKTRSIFYFLDQFEITA
jgi:hypothetical protein